MALVLENRRKQRVRLIRKSLLTALIVALCLVLSYTAFRRWTLLSPPADEGPPLPAQAEARVVDGRLRAAVGESAMERRDGIWRLELAGDPRHVGHAHGVLARGVSDELERHMERLTQQHAPGALTRWLIGNGIRWRFRRLTEWFPPQRIVELAALSRAMADSAEYAELPYQRIVYYHALYELTQQLEESPLIACTAFAARGAQAFDGHLIVGRNFDFDAGEIFDRHKAVLLFRSAAIPFVSVAWPGMTGVVTGVNAKRLYVSLNAARTDQPLGEGMPIVFLVRELLERADSIPAALALIKQREVMGAQALLIASGATGEAAVVELAPGKLAVRRMEGNWIAVANHFVHRSFQGDARNDRLRRYSTSDARYRRVSQLLRRHERRMDPATAALILRNRTDLDDEPLALGHRRAIDALRATHGVVVDLADLVLWVSSGPALLGPYAAIDLKPLLGVPAGPGGEAPKPIAADPLLGSPEHERQLLVEAALEHARRLERAGNLVAALDFARRAVRGSPRLPAARKLLGDLLWALGSRDYAREHYREFLALRPPYRAEVEQIQERLGQ